MASRMVLGNRLKGGRPARVKMRMFRMGERLLSSYEYDTLDLTKIGGNPAYSPKHIRVDEVERFFDRAGKGKEGATVTDPRMTTGAVVFAVMELDGEFTNKYFYRMRTENMIDGIESGYRSWGDQPAEQESIGIRFSLRQMDAETAAYFDNSMFKTSNILWEFSPDGGRGKWYQLYELPNQKNMRINLPEPTNQIKLRAVSNNPEEWVQAIAVSIKQDWQNTAVEPLHWYLPGESQDPADYIDFDDLGYLSWPEAHGGRGDVIYELYWSPEEDFQDTVLLGRTKRNDLAPDEFEMPVQYLGGWLHVLAYDIAGFIAISKRFTRSLIDAVVEVSPTQYVYDATAHQPNVTVVFKLDGSVIPPEFYSVEYVRNIEAGTCTVVCTGVDYYVDTPKEPGYFEIFRRDIADCDVEVEYDTVVYIGQPLEPSVSVTINGVEVSPSNYTLTYEDTVDVGIGSVTMECRNSLIGSLVAYYEITPASLSSMSIEPSTYEYASSRAVPVEEVIGVGQSVAVRDVDYDLDVPEIADAIGTYTFTAIGKGNYTGEVSASLTITKADFSTAEMDDVPVQYYINEQIKPKPVVRRHEVLPDGTEADRELAEGIDFYYTWGENIYPSGTVSATGMGNYTNDVLSEQFDIEVPVIHIWEGGLKITWKHMKAVTWQHVIDEG